MMDTTKQYVFSLYFNFRDGDASRGRTWAEEKRKSALAYLKRLFENKAQFSCVAKDENNTCLMLKGYMKLNSPCTQAYAKRLLGKYSSCKPSYFGDMVSLCRLVHIDRDLAVTGRLPKGMGGSTKKLKSFPVIFNLLLKSCDSIDRNDLDHNNHEQTEGKS